MSGLAIFCRHSTDNSSVCKGTSSEYMSLNRSSAETSSTCARIAGVIIALTAWVKCSMMSDWFRATISSVAIRSLIVIFFPGFFSQYASAGAFRLYALIQLQSACKLSASSAKQMRHASHLIPAYVPTLRSDRAQNVFFLDHSSWRVFQCLA